MAARHRSRCGYRHLEPDSPGAQSVVVSVHQPGQRAPEGGDRGVSEGAARQARLHAATRLHQPGRADAARSPAAGRTPAHQPRAGQQRRPARRRGRPQRDHQRHGQRGGPSPLAGDSLRLRPRRGLARRRSARRQARGTRPLRLQRGARLSHRLPDQRRDRIARQRHAPPPRPGPDQADRKGLPRLAKNQPRRARPVRRR